jgi:hypothetical protein
MNYNVMLELISKRWKFSVESSFSGGRMVHEFLLKRLYRKTPTTETYYRILHAACSSLSNRLNFDSLFPVKMGRSLHEYRYTDSIKIFIVFLPPGWLEGGEVFVQHHPHLNCGGVGERIPYSIAK